jgi:hypothetical protein
MHPPENKQKESPHKESTPKIPVWIATMVLLCFNVTISGRDKAALPGRSSA